MDISQTMAECDCQHNACAMRKYCMAAEIDRLRLALTAIKHKGNRSKASDIARNVLENKQRVNR